MKVRNDDVATVFDNTNKGPHGESTFFTVEFILHRLNEVCTEPLHVGDDGVGEGLSKYFEHFEEDDFETFVVDSILEIVKKQLEEFADVASDDDWGVLNQNREGLDPVGFFVVVFEVGAEVVETIVGYFLQKGRYHWGGVSIV